MKILQVLAGGKHGGAETAFVDMCLAMAETGQDIEVATRPNPIRVPQLKEAGLTVHTLPFGGKLDVITSWRLTQIIKNFQPDIVQSWMSRASSKVPAWSPAMGIAPYATCARLGGYYKLKYFKTTSYFVPITPDIGKHLEAGGIDPSCIQHISNFAETEDVVTPINRADYDTPENAPLLLGLGRLHDAKAFDTLIKVVARIPGTHLWIAGEGPQRAELESLIQDLNVQDRVKLLGWRNDRAALLQAANICMFTSRFEPFGTVFLQAWAQKIPVIVSDADGPKQFVRDGEDSLMVPIDDETALQNAIEKLSHDSQLQNTLIKNGFARYQSEFTKETCVQNYLDFYTDILARERAAKAA